MDFSHLCRAPCCLHNPGHYGFVKKSPQFGAVRLFFLFFFSQDGKKTTVDLLISFFFFYLEENSANVPWSGWDEEITKQTGGFYKRPKSCSQEPKGKKKKAENYSRGQERRRKHGPLSKIIKNQTIKEIIGERRRSESAFSNKLTNEESLGVVEDKSR